MFDLNQIVREQGDMGLKLQMLLRPQLYLATSISNFLNRRTEIKTTPFLKSFFLHPFYPTLYNAAGIIFQNLYYNRESEDSFSLSDATETMMVWIAVPPYHDQMIASEKIKDGDRVAQVNIIYNKKEDSAYFWFMKKFHDIEVSDKDTVDENLEGLLLAV